MSKISKSEYDKIRYQNNKKDILAKRKERYNRDKCRVKNNYLKYNYGITLEQYNLMYDNQNGVCAICKKQETGKHQSGKIKKLSVDHNHITGKVRALLCSKCNTALGKFKERFELLEAAITYLLKHKDNA